MGNFIFCAVFVARHKNSLYYFPDKLVFCKPFKLESFPIISSTRAKEFLTGYSLKIDDFKTHNKLCKFRGQGTNYDKNRSKC